MNHAQFIQLCRCVARDIGLSGDGGTYFYPPPFLWKQRFTLRDVRLAWSRAFRKQQASPSGKINFGLYVHIPFCYSRCSFCFATSFPNLNDDEHNLYVKCLEQEIRLLDFPKGAPIKTFNIGGGTPSALSERNLEKLLGLVHRSFDLYACSQKSVEISPVNVTRRKMAILKDAGMDRVSIGVQSLDDKVLKSNTRWQPLEGVTDCYMNVRAAGFRCVNVDLMTGLPGQTLESFRRTLAAVLRLRPDTVSIYPFRPQDTTLFYQSGRRLSSKDIALRSAMAQEYVRIMDALGPSSTVNPNKTQEPRLMNQMDYYATQFNSSIIGIGYGAVSHAFSSLNYRKEADYSNYIKRLSAGRFPLLSGYRLNAQTEMRAFLVRRLAKKGEVSLLEFRDIFGLFVEHVFCDEISFLKKLRRIEIKDNMLRLVTDDPLDREVYSKIFLGKALLKQFADVIRRHKYRYRDIQLELLACYS
jgi:oxygen-independent coproporphyrinogen-3 oxidase